MNTVMLVAGAALNSLWQAAALAFLVWLGIELLGPRTNAATRHLVWWMALAAMAILPAEKGKGPVEVLVIDHPAKPSEN